MGRSAIHHSVVCSRHVLKYLQFKFGTSEIGAGRYECTFTTSFGNMTLRMPKLKGILLVSYLLG